VTLIGFLFTRCVDFSLKCITMHLLAGLPSVPLQYVGRVDGYWTGNRGTRGAKTVSGKAGYKGEDGFGVGGSRREDICHGC